MKSNLCEVKYLCPANSEKYAWIKTTAAKLAGPENASFVFPHCYKFETLIIWKIFDVTRCSRTRDQMVSDLL